MQKLAIATTIALSGGLALTAALSHSAPLVAHIGCEQSLNLMNSVRSHTSAQRLVLGRVWLPKSTVVLGRNAWRHIPMGQDAFIKFGVGVIPGAPVVLEVPVDWRAKYALSFHGVPDGGVAVLHLDPCPKSDGPSTVWAGGYLVKHPACVPLVVRAGRRIKQVSLSLGRHC